MPLESRGLAERARLVLFLATGLAVPLFAFPVARVAGRSLDAASLLAEVFVAASLPAWFRRSAVASRAPWLVATAAIVPLLVLLPPRPEDFSPPAFAVSFAHWILVVLFFASALTLLPGRTDALLLVRWHLAAGALVAAFAIYQLIGIPHGWPGTGATLGSFQREPFRFTPIGATYAGGGYMRPTSIFLEPAWMGGFLAWTVALALLAPRAETPADRILRLAAGLLAAAAIAASVSWGAYVDLLVVLIAASASFSGRLPARRAVALGATAAAVLVIALATPPARRVASAVGERLLLLEKTTSATPSTATADTPRVRWENAQQSWRLFVSHVLRGIGLGQFGRHVWETPGGASFAASLSRRDPWVGWIEIAAEAGALGPLLLAIPIGVVAFRARARASDWGPVALALASLAAVQQLHTASYIDLWWWYPLALGAVLAGSTGHRSERGRPA